MRLCVPPGTLKAFPSQQAINISQPGAEEGKTVNLAIISQGGGREDNLYPDVPGTERGSEECGRTQPCSYGYMRLG